jgi:NAD-dependent deacetylase
MEPFELRLERAVSLIRDTRDVCAFTGAGISTESGISDFRSPGGVWDRYRVVTYQEFLASHDARVEYWRMKKALHEEIKGAAPNAAHDALAALERMGKLRCLVTQNIDGLHQDAGSSPELVIELHGTNRKAVCLGCGNTWPIGHIHARLKAGEDDPACGDCGGLIKPATVSFGQSMPEAEMRRALACAIQCRVFLMIGSSLQVEPAASVPPEAHRAGARLVFVNRTPTPWDHMAELLFREDAGHVLSGIVRGLAEHA